MAEARSQAGSRGKRGAARSAAEAQQESDAKEQVREKAQVAQQKVHEQAEQASGRVKQEVDRRSTQAGEQVASTAEALRSSSEHLRAQGNEREAKATERVAERAERLGTYLRDKDGDTILGDLEDFGRRQPLVVALGGVALGFAAARFLRASSSERYERSGGYDGYRERSRQYYSSRPPRSSPYGVGARGDATSTVELESRATSPHDPPAAS
jgi:hypothetical protein